MRPELTREALVLWLSKTQAASRELSPEQRKLFCEKVGIKEELYLEAHMLRAKMSFKLFNAQGRHGDYIARKVSQQVDASVVVAHCSVELKDHIMAHCKTRNVDHSTLGRSLIHHYLRGTWEPEYVIGKWTIRNFEGDQSAVKEAVINVRVTQAAKEALTLRATAYGSSPTKMFRALISAALNGDFAQPGTIRYVSAGQMYSQIEKYVLPDSP